MTGQLKLVCLTVLKDGEREEEGTGYMCMKVLEVIACVCSETYERGFGGLGLCMTN